MFGPTKEQRAWLCLALEKLSAMVTAGAPRTFPTAQAAIEAAGPVPEGWSTERASERVFDYLPAQYWPMSAVCGSCKGLGYRDTAAWTSEAYTTEAWRDARTKTTYPARHVPAKHYPARRDPCSSCKGAERFERPVLEQLLPPVLSKKSRGGLVSKRPEAARPYFLWRTIRFHTGADVTMPMTASYEIGGDPYMSLIDTWAREVAARLTGGRSAGSARWNAAFTGEDAGPGLAMSAYSSGPVVLDGNKPASERLELGEYNGE